MSAGAAGELEVQGAQPADVGRPRRVARLRKAVPPEVAVAIAFVALVVVCAIAGSLLAPYAPAREDLVSGLQGPSAHHLLGTDEAGRDILSRLVAGSRAALVGPLVVVIGAMLIGTFFGLLAGYRGGWVDGLIMRVVDLLYSLPGLLIAVVVLGVFGGGYWIAVLVLVVLTAPYDTRLIRGATLGQRGLPYVDAARTLGLRPSQIMARHIWPNVLPLIIANSFLNFAFALVGLASLAFLGLGTGPGATDWGQMLSEGLPLIEENPAAVLAPGIALVLLALSMNLVGDWINERLAARGAAR